ncbi:hypothetical protein Tco_0090235 [Tanacetum coccineum]
MWRMTRIEVETHDGGKTEMGIVGAMAVERSQAKNKARCQPNNSVKGNQWTGRTIQAEDNEINDDLMSRSVVGQLACCSSVFLDQMNSVFKTADE